MLVIFQEKENRRAEMLALVEIQEAGRKALESMHAERRKKAKVFKNQILLFIIYVETIPSSTVNFPTQNYKILYHTSCFFRFHITVLLYAGFQFCSDVKD